MSTLQEKATTTPGLPTSRRGPFTLVPVLPSTNNRYNQVASNKVTLPKVQPIPPWTRVGSFWPPIPLVGWECHVHPEGDKYYRHARLRAVTPVSPLNLVAGRILEQAATALIEALGSAGGDNTIEIYLNIPDDRKNAVQYCYIDHTNRQVFWARATSTVELGLESFESDDFLKWALTREYWNHVENFPSHHIFWADPEDELIVIFIHGAIVHRPSTPSSSVHDADVKQERVSPSSEDSALTVSAGIISSAHVPNVEQQLVSPRERTPAVSIPSSATSLAPIPEVGDMITWISPMPVKVNGHFCDVYQGTHSTAGKVALKRPRIGTADDEGAMRRFQREAETWASLQHPHILEYLGTFQRDGHFYFVSPFIKNGTLAEYIALHLNVDRIKLTCETADAIAYLHRQDIVHGDIKANNLLIADNGQVLLCDFGLARATDFRTSTAMRGAGTLRWQSPELWIGGSKSFKSDVYAFGMTIVEVLTEAVPFPDLGTGGAVIFAVLIEGRRPPKIPTESPAGLSYEKVWAVAEACWSADPEERICMSEALQRIQEDPALARVQEV